MPDRTLVVMLKEPRPGRVKTRLGAEIGHVAACWWFRHQVRSLLRRIDDPRWQVVLAVSPDRACASRLLPRGFLRIPQGGGDLGARMVRAMRAAPPGPVCVIGADVPGITRAAIWRAFRALGSAEAVFGPADDGGYWLVGLAQSSRLMAGLLADVRWSTPDALAESVASLNGRTVAYVDQLADVDRAADLRRMRAE